MTSHIFLTRPALALAAGMSAVLLGACSLSYTEAETPAPTIPAPTLTTTTTAVPVGPAGDGEPVVEDGEVPGPPSPPEGPTPPAPPEGP